MVGRVRLQVSSLPSTTLHKAPLSLSSIPISRVVFAIHNRRPRFRQFRDVAADPDNPSSRLLTDADLLSYSPRFILFILRLDIHVCISSRTLHLILRILFSGCLSCYSYLFRQFLLGLSFGCVGLLLWSRY